MCALVCMLVALCWQALTVNRNYGGNWTALFCAGQQLTLPPDFEHVYRFPDGRGFDGIYYYLIAHDPLMRTPVSRAVEYPGLRYRRILVPALAHVSALGNPEWVGTAFIGVNLAFLFAGVWWSCSFFAARNRNPAWGILFVALPAVPIALDRLTIDLALVALAVATVVVWDSGRRGMLITLLILASLTRETGLLLMAAYGVHYAWRRDWRMAAMVGASAIPFMAWSTYVNRAHPPELWIWLAHAPFAHTWKFLTAPQPYGLGPIPAVLRAFDLLALAGTALALWWARPRWDYLREPFFLAGGIFMALGVYLFMLEEWTHVYDYGRVLSPMLAAVAFRAVLFRQWVALCAVGAITARVGVQLGPQVLGIFR